MDNFNLPRKLTAAEVTTLKANITANRAIFEAAGWFVPIPDASQMSTLGDKGETYVDDAREILELNQAELGAFINLQDFQNAADLHDQAQELEDLALDNLTAPHNVSLIAGAAAKKDADDEYVVLKGLERLNSKWKASVERLAARYKGQGPQKKPAP